MRPFAIFFPVGGVLAFLLVAPLSANRVQAEERPVFRSSTITGKQKLLAVMRPTRTGTVEGSVLFERIAGGVRVTARIGGLKRDSVHALRIQGVSNDGANAVSSGDVLAPGDLGNVMSDENGNATHVMDLDRRALNSGGLLGLTVTVHENAGNGESPDRAAGDPIGAGVIRPLR